MSHNFAIGDDVYVINQNGEPMGARPGDPTAYEVVDLDGHRIQIGRGYPDPHHNNRGWFDPAALRHIRI